MEVANRNAVCDFCSEYFRFPLSAFISSSTAIQCAAAFGLCAQKGEREVGS